MPTDSTLIIRYISSCLAVIILLALTSIISATVLFGIQYLVFPSFGWKLLAWSQYYWIWLMINVIFQFIPLLRDIRDAN